MVFFIRILSFVLFFAGFSSARQVPASHAAWDLDFPDPSIIKDADGFYYAYATQTITETSPPRLINIQVARSKDLNSWTLLGEALPTKPTWAQKTQKFWAPHVSVHNGKYFLYFSAQRDGQDGLCLAVGVSNSPRGPFSDTGSPLRCGSGFENIDPMEFEDPVSQKPYLYWGSGFAPLRVQALAEDRISFELNSQPKDIVYPQPNSAPEKYMRLIEGSWVEYKNGNYFLFFSGDNCCEPTPHYAVMIAKSKSPLGPFRLMEEDTKTSSVILEQSHEFIGPGHNAVITNDQGHSFIFYHAIDIHQSQLRYPIPGDRKVRRVLMKDRLCWPKNRDGWPRVSDNGDCN